MKRNLLVLLVVLLLLGWMLHPSEGVPILAYHKVSDDEEMYSVSPQQFAAHMQYLKENGYTAVSLAEMADAFSGKTKLPSKPIVITFDDGYADNLLIALPIMEHYSMKATVFVIAGSLGQGEYLSWEQAAEMQRRGTEIGSHTVSHIPLGKATEAQKFEEIWQSRVIIENKLKTPVQFLAYPFGQFDSFLFAALERSGYRGACTGIAGLNYADTPPYQWKRINLPRPKFGMIEFRLRLLRAQLVSW